MFGTRTAIANAEQNQQNTEQSPTTAAQPSRSNVSVASSSTSTPVVVAQPSTENSGSQISDLSAEVQRTMRVLTQAQSSHQDERRHDTTKGRNIFRSLQEEMVIYDNPEGDNMCSICLDNFEEGETVVRLTCKHIFHASCWNECYTRGPRSITQDEQDPSCPNCRGRGTMLAVWGYMDPTLVTQHELQARTTAYLQEHAPPEQEQQEQAQQEQEATQTYIMTPRSVVTERIHESPAVDVVMGGSAEAGRRTETQSLEEAILGTPSLEETFLDLPTPERAVSLPVFTLEPCTTQN